jgi:hypothetical protein
MGKGAVRLEPEALWPQLNLLVGDVLAAADWLTAHGGPGALCASLSTCCLQLLSALHLLVSSGLAAAG